jgi:uncharacterized protein (DUF2141 family)
MSSVITRGLLVGLLFAGLVPAYAAGASLRVRLEGVSEGRGELGCALYRSAAGFPTDASQAQPQWLPAQREGGVCRFEGLAPGRYAVAASHDLNGNRRTDTNLFGIPQEAWAVSNNVRPTLRAPRFDEAAVQIEGDTELVLRLQR